MTLKKSKKPLQTIKKHQRSSEIVYNGSISCPNCGSKKIIIEGRCSTCLECGWSECPI